MHIFLGRRLEIFQSTVLRRTDARLGAINEALNVKTIYVDIDKF